MECFIKVSFLTLLTLTTWSCGRTDKQETLIQANSVLVDSLIQSSIEPINDKASPYTIIGYKLRNAATNTVHTVLINDNNPFINRSLSLDTSQYDWQALQRQGSFMYDISNSKLNEISSMLSSSIPDDSITKYRFSRASTYCNHQISKNYLILNYTLSVHAFKKQNKGVSEVISLSTKLLVLNEARKVVFDISERGLGIGEVLISDNKKYLTIYGVDYPMGKPCSSYRVYDLTTKGLLNSKQFLMG